MQIQIIRAKTGEPVMYRNVFHAAYVIVKTHGIRGAYQGLPATWLRNIPANSAFFGEFNPDKMQVFTSQWSAVLIVRKQLKEIPALKGLI